MLSLSVSEITSNVQLKRWIYTGRILRPLTANAILISPFRGSVHILSLFTSISNNTRHFIIEGQEVASSRDIPTSFPGFSVFPGNKEEDTRENMDLYL